MREMYGVLPSFEVKRGPTSSAKHGFEAAFKQQLSTYHFNDSPFFKLKLFHIADRANI
ncbi:hypothetical protein H8H21_13985, partial [Staphylococcus aureus]|nr:hypothetical protein [Staphylococcus aureus]